MASGETLPLAFDVYALLASGESASSPTCALTRLDTGASYAAGLSGNPTVSGTTITQAITALANGVTYRLAVTFTAAAGKTWTVLLDIRCVA